MRTTAYRYYLREWREHRGLYQEELARRVHVAKSVISRFETGGRHIKMDMHYKLARALKIDAWQLFYPVGTSPIDATMATMSPELRAQFENWLKEPKTASAE
jgi:transcriptional regulator with XRE-family HTH domain